MSHKPCGTLRELLLQIPNACRSNVIYRVHYKWSNAYYLRESRKTQQRRIREHQGAVRKRETTSLIWVHTADTSHNFNIEGAQYIDHGRFKGERLVKESQRTILWQRIRNIHIPITTSQVTLLRCIFFYQNIY